MDDDLREKMIVEKIGLSREHAEWLTPKTLKGLKPPLPEDAPRKCVLCWQLSKASFQGYYPKPMDEDQAKPKKRARKKTKPETDKESHWSCSRKYGVVLKSTLSKLDALWQVVSFLWDRHSRQGHEAETFY